MASFRLTREAIEDLDSIWYPNYVILYDPHARPLPILRVLHGMRDLKRLLKP